VTTGFGTTVVSVAPAVAATAVGSASGTLDELLRAAVGLGASDLHLTVGRPPMVRLLGELSPLPGHAELRREDTALLVATVCDDVEQARFDELHELDSAYSVAGVGRFRVSAFVQRGAVGAVLRSIPHAIPPFASLGLPESVQALARVPRGLVLVTGPTGSGKSTTLASMLDLVNAERAVHIVTIEDPIEYLHSHRRAIVNQRQVGDDTRSFSVALRQVLRQDPDVILIGELRDLETMSTALTAAETGHLVLASLHTQDAAQTIDRIIDVVPPAQQGQVRSQLSTTLQGVVAQQLLPRADGSGRVVACEVLVATSAVRALVREGKAHQLTSVIQTGSQHGMQTMDQSLAALVRDGIVSVEAAREVAQEPQDLGRLGAASAASTASVW
jgi:twitching motility protein PilT